MRGEQADLLPGKNMAEAARNNPFANGGVEFGTANATGLITLGAISHSEKPD
jgi:hypothetical protein